jgi:hypothetical protein
MEILSYIAFAIVLPAIGGFGIGYGIAYLFLEWRNSHHG